MYQLLAQSNLHASLHLLLHHIPSILALLILQRYIGSENVALAEELPGLNYIVYAWKSLEGCSYT